MVAKAYTQIYGIDYLETFVPTTKMNDEHSEGLNVLRIQFDWK